MIMVDIAAETERIGLTAFGQIGSGFQVADLVLLVPYQTVGAARVLTGAAATAVAVTGAVGGVAVVAQGEVACEVADG